MRRLGAEGLYDRVLPLEQPSFEDRLRTVDERIKRALGRCGRHRSDVSLVAVTKKFSAEHIRMAYRAGLREFGENYVQEFADKQHAVKDLQDARFHFIGRLQSNKARVACQLFEVIETADSAKVLQRLDAAAAEQGKTIEILLEVKLSREESKTGAAPEEVQGLLAAGASCLHLRITGLMTIPPWSLNAESSRPYFKQLAALARANGLGQLSMGMSNDFEVAIEEGATVVRVGTALFGPRPKPEKAASPAGAA